MWKKCDLRICHSLCIHFFVHCTWYLCGTGTFESISIAYIYIVFSELTFFKNIFVCANKHTHTQYTCTYTYTILSPRKSSTWLHIISRFRFTIEFEWFWDGKRRISLLPHRHQLIKLQRIRIRIPFTLNHILANPKENHIYVDFSVAFFLQSSFHSTPYSTYQIIVRLWLYNYPDSLKSHRSYFHTTQAQNSNSESYIHSNYSLSMPFKLFFEHFFLGLLHSNKSVYESIARCFFWNFIKAIIYTIDQDCSPIPLLLSGNISPLILCDPRFFIQNKKKRTKFFFAEKQSRRV